MNGHRSTFASVGLAGCMMLGLMLPGCGGGLGEVTVRQEPSGDRPTLPPITVERLRQCVADYRHQLKPGRHWLNPHVEVDQDGFHRKVSTDDIPQTAYDLGACTRVVLHDMAIPSSILMSPPPEDAPTMNRSYMGSQALVLVFVELGPIVIVAAAVTIVLVVTVEVARRPRWEKECLDGYVECMDSRVGDELGNNWNTTRCGTCKDVCENKKSWPSQILMFEGWVSCGRLGPTWKN